MSRNIIYFVVFVISITSCIKNTPINKSEIIGEFNGESIYAVEVDKLIQQELFDQLNQIYAIKSKAFDAYIDLRLLQHEAKSRNLNADDYAEQYALHKMQRVGIDSLYEQYQLNQRVKFHGLNMSVVDKESLEENVKLKYNLKAFIIRDLLDSLKKSTDVKKYVYPPKSPNIDLSGQLVYVRGNKDSKVTFFTISDFDCNKCIESQPLFDSLYVKYKDRVKFGYINFSATPTLAQLACNAANEQGVFWSYHDSLYNQKCFIDSVIVYNIAKEMNLDIDQFKKDLLDPKAAEMINGTINELVEKGIFATPTVLINKRLIYNSASFDEISHLIEEELGE